MSIAFRSALLAVSLLWVGSCATPEGGATGVSRQALVEAIAAKNTDVLRLTIHAIPKGEIAYKAVASTLGSKIGKLSDPEDLKAIRFGEVVVLDEPEGIDVTVPICRVDGKHSIVTGVTMKKSIGRAAAIEAARAIAAEMEAELSKR